MSLKADLILLIGPLIGAGITLPCALYGWTMRRRLRTWRRVDGIVVGKVQGDSAAAAPVNAMSVLVIAYEFDGVSRQLTSSSAFRDPPRDGSRIPVLVNPRNPEEACHFGRRFLSQVYVPLGFGLFFFAAGIGFDLLVWTAIAGGAE